MKRLVLIQSVIIAALAAALVWSGGHGGAFQLGVAYAGSGSDETLPADRPVDVPIGPAAPNAGPTTLVYFQPQDNDANATVIVLSNSANVTQTVVMRGYTASSGAFGVWSVPVGPYGLMHLVSDGLAAAPPPSFANSVVTNFTDFTSYATLEVPPGMHIDGYLIFNPGTGTVDPRLDQGAVPLRFSTDPYAVMLPTVRQ